MPFLRRLFQPALAVCILAVSLGAQAQTVRIEADSALTAVVRHFGWLEAAGLNVSWGNAAQPSAQPADYTSAGAAAALAARAAGSPVKAVYVLSRTVEAGSGAEFLLVSEAALQQRPQQVHAVLAALERARLWVNAEPDAAARIAGAAVQGRSFAGSRPGPAQLMALKALARERGVDEQLGAALLDDSAYRAVLRAL